MSASSSCEFVAIVGVKLDPVADPGEADHVEQQHVGDHLVVHIGEELLTRACARSSPVAAVALAISSSTFGSAIPDCRPSLAYLKNIENTGSPRLLSCCTASICGGRPSLYGLL